MERNVGSTDRTIRLAIAAVALLGALFFGLGSVLGVVLLVVAVVLGVTAFVRFCPLYRVLGVSTCATKSRSR